MIPDLSEELEAWKREYEQAEGYKLPGAQGQTAKEIMAALGLRRTTVQRFLAAGIKSGRIKKPGVRYIRNESGGFNPAPVYQIIKEETK